MIEPFFLCAETGGFEPPMGFPPCRISSAVPSTTQPRLRVLKLYLMTSFEVEPIDDSCAHFYYVSCVIVGTEYFRE